MEGISIIIPVLNKLEITQKCINHIKEFNKEYTYEIIIIDNGSTDNTPEILSKDKNIVYIRNQENLGLSKAYNYAGKIAKYDTFCFMHNDAFIFEKDWIMAIHNFIMKTSNAGIVGLYGAKHIRRDGSFRGKTIVQSMKNHSSMHQQYEKVAVVDGLFMAVKKSVFQKIGGFSNDFTIHFYDKDISLKAYRNGLNNFVINIPFEHICATTRKRIKRDDKIRDEAQRNFVKIWGDFLPVDVSTWLEKITYLWKRGNR